MVDNKYTGVGYEPPFEFADDQQDRAPMTEAIEEYKKLQSERDQAIREVARLGRELGKCSFERDRAIDAQKVLELEVHKLNSYINLLLAAVRALVEAAEKLTTKMEDIYVHPEYQAVWMHYNNLSYGGYKGPQWTKEFDNLKELIASVERMEVE